MQEGFEASGDVLPRDSAPPAITVAIVSGLAVPGALVEIDAVAVVPAADCPDRSQWAPRAS